MQSIDAAWRQFADFQVLANHAPMTGFVTVERLTPDRQMLLDLVAARAAEASPLDPNTAVAVMRAGLGLARLSGVELVWSTIDEATIILSGDASGGAGGQMAVHDRLLSSYASRLALLLGTEIPVASSIFEFPDRASARRALVAVQVSSEETLPERAARRIGAQITGRGGNFHPAMVDSIEEQLAFLAQHSVDVERLPPWWWRGAAARRGRDTVELVDRLPDGEEFAAFIG